MPELEDAIEARRAQTGSRFARGAAFLSNNRAALVSFAMRMAGVAAGFALTFVIGRYFGPSASAQYAIVAQTALFLSVIAIGGLDLSVVREFSRAVGQGCKIARASFWGVIAQSGLIALALCGVLALWGRDVLDLIGRGEVPKGAVFVLCLILAGRTLTRILAALLRSQRDYVFSQAVETTLIPVLTIGAVVAGLAASVPQILWATALAGLAVSALAVLAGLRHTSGDADALKVSAGSLIAFALPLWAGSIAQTFADWYGLVTVSSVNGLHDAGLFRTAVQYAAIFPVVAMGLFTTYSAQISAAVQAHDRAGVARLAGSATRLAAVLVLPGAVAAFVLAEPLLRLVGPEFADGAAILRVLVLGQVFYCITGPSGLVLALSGHPRWNFRVNMVAAVLLLALAPLAAREAGPVAVAALVALLLAGRNLACFALVYRSEGINVLTGRLRPLFRPGSA